MSPTDVIAPCERFELAGNVVAVDELHVGHINDSYLVTCSTRDGPRRYVLQRVNDSVFPDVDGLMANIAIVTAHLGGAGVPQLVPTRDGHSHWGRWRAFEFVDGARPMRVQTAAHAASLGRAFGCFHRALAELDPELLSETIPAFHDVRRRVRDLDAVVAADPSGRVTASRSELAHVDAHRDLVAVADRLAPPHVPTRVVHNDAKADNVLLDAATGEPVCIVDLDTVMPGTVLSDVGDLVRSATTNVPEDEPDAARVDFDRDRFDALLRGYREETDALLTPAERDGLVLAGPVITFEQAVRFLADHLAGDVYYRVTRPGHNLDRARNQLALLDAMRAALA
jgi:Ser/Thr protein kinase RdoA (MazF antagonist)